MPRLSKEREENQRKVEAIRSGNTDSDSAANKKRTWGEIGEMVGGEGGKRWPIIILTIAVLAYLYPLLRKALEYEDHLWLAGHIVGLCILLGLAVVAWSKIKQEPWLILLSIFLFVAVMGNFALDAYSRNHCKPNDKTCLERRERREKAEAAADSTERAEQAEAARNAGQPIPYQIIYRDWTQLNIRQGFLNRFSCARGDECPAYLVRINGSKIHTIPAGDPRINWRSFGVDNIWNIELKLAAPGPRETFTVFQWTSTGD